MGESREELYGIVSKCYENGDFKRLISPFHTGKCANIPYNLRFDLEQEIILILMEYKDPKKIVDMYNRSKDELFGFILGIIKNNVASTTSHFWRKYNRYESNKSSFGDKLC